MASSLQASACPTCNSDVQVYDSLGMKNYVPRRSYVTVELLVWLGVAAWGITFRKACEMLALTPEEGADRFAAWWASDFAHSLPDHQTMRAREDEDEGGVPAEIPDWLAG